MQRSKKTFFFFHLRARRGLKLSSLSSILLFLSHPKGLESQKCLKSKWMKANALNDLVPSTDPAIFTEAKILFLVRKTTPLDQSKLGQPKSPVTLQDQ